ncbi:MAG TPA: 4-hydroxythreonine-4-phosphate dehydrogenase PdxA [Thermoanaerobaculia bacterium]|nr:4-hydroxythreonine-4-phosphate dehydrogenase PdxA [Thermoanaerobaculia bacterium]
MSRPLLAFTQGDPAGIGPEVLARALLSSAATPRADFLPLLVAEAVALRALHPSLPDLPWERLVEVGAEPTHEDLGGIVDRGGLPVLDPVGEARQLLLGTSGPADAAGAMAALDTAIGLVAGGTAHALVTAPMSKRSVARHVRPGFAGHTEYLAAAAGLERYGRDYLMAFLAPDLQVALLTTHLPLREALDRVTPTAIEEALVCLDRGAGGRLAVAGFDPHAGEGGLLGDEDARQVAPAVAAGRRRGLDVHGPESADSVFARARRGEFDWVLALDHDQGLIAVKTAAFGSATNWTLGLPWLRTSVDHGTAFPLAGHAAADATPMRAVIATTLGLLRGELPRRAFRAPS